MVRGLTSRRSGPASSSSGAGKQSPSRNAIEHLLTEDEKHHAHESDEHEDNCASGDDGSGGRSSGKGASHQQNPRNANEEAASGNDDVVDLCENLSDVDADQKGRPPTTKESRPSSSTSQQRKRNRAETMRGEQNSREGADESDFEVDKHLNNNKKKKRKTDDCSDASSQSSESTPRKQKNGGKATRRSSSILGDEESRERKPLLHSSASSTTSSVRSSESSKPKRTSKQRGTPISRKRNGQKFRRRAEKLNERDGRDGDQDLRKGLVHNQSEREARLRNRVDRRASDDASDSDDEDKPTVKVAAGTPVDDSDSEGFKVKSPSTEERGRENEDEKNEDDYEKEDVATGRETRSKRGRRAAPAVENQAASGGAPRSAAQGQKLRSRARTSGPLSPRDVDTSSRAQPKGFLMGSHAMAESESTSDGHRNDAHDSPSANVLASPTRSGSPKFHDTSGHAPSTSQDDSSMDGESEPSIPQVHIAMKVKFYGICRNADMGKHSETWEESGMKIIGVYADKSSAQTAIQKDKAGLFNYPYDADGVRWDFLCLEAKHFGGAQ